MIVKSSRAEHFALNRRLLLSKKRKCFSCHEIKNISEFPKNNNRYNGSCKACENLKRLKKNARSNRIMAQRQLAKQGKKYCPGCDKIKSLEEFEVNLKDRKYSYKCRACRIKHCVDYRKKKKIGKSKNQYNLKL